MGILKACLFLLGFSLASSFWLCCLAEQCGKQAGGALCPDKNNCCSEYGYCGSTSLYCCAGCQSQCHCETPPSYSPPPPSPPPPPPSPPPPPAPPSPVSDIINKTLFEDMLKHRNDAACPAKGFYTYEAFIAATRIYNDFATTGSLEDRQREIAAFFGQTSQETTGGWPGAPDGPYAWGYCFNKEFPCKDYCEYSPQWPCAPGQQYCGRGPIQLSYNYNYGPAGRDLELDLLSHPDQVATNPVISFETALWFWMTPQSPKPSCHDVITGNWTPTSADLAAGRVPGYGVITNIINGGVECGKGENDKVKNRIGFYKRYCEQLGVDPGDNLDCFTQKPFGSGLLVSALK